MKSKSLIVIGVLLIFSGISEAQKVDSTINLNLLQAPVSPASDLLGISSSDIQKPADPQAFMVSLQTLTSNFTKIPNNFAIDFAPAWTFGGKRIKLEDFLNLNNKSDFSRSLCQSMVISIAVKNIDTIKSITTQLSFGLKLSLIRGKVYDDSLFINLVNDTKHLNQMLLNYDSLVIHDDNLQILQSIMTKLLKAPKKNIDSIKLIGSQIENKLHLIQSSYYNIPSTKAKVDSLRIISENIKFIRYGFNLDFCGGAVFDFPDQNFKQGTTTKVGLWLTGSYDLKPSKVNKTNWSFLLIARYLYNPNQLIGSADTLNKNNDYHTFDLGGRIVCNVLSNKFLVSAESIYRSILNNSKLEPGWRFTVNVEYELMRNIRLNLSIGKDFNNVYTSNGNVIAALNIIMGFGSKKSIL